MIKRLRVSCTLILTFFVVIALASSSAFFGLEKAWADSVIATISVGSGPIGIAIDPAHNKVYVVDDNSNDVTVIDGSTNLATGTVSVGLAPFALTPSPQQVQPGRTTQ